MQPFNFPNEYSLGQEYDFPNQFPSNFFNGEMDDFRVWDFPKTIGQIQSQMYSEMSGTEPGLILLYNFNQGIPSGNNTTITNVVNLTAEPGLNGNLFNFTLNGSASNFIMNECCRRDDFCHHIDSSYIQVTDNINENTVWSGKIYIPSNTVILVDGAILDITNVDVVFGFCSGIDFVNGAQLRANNSVFRPCDINGNWRGLRFDGVVEFSHQINENTFKNAEKALVFERNSLAQINSNTFSNCNRGVLIEQSHFSETIFGNNFVTNSSYPEYSRCCSLFDPNEVIHIHIVGAEGWNEVTNPLLFSNSFIMSNQFGVISTTAIEIFNSYATITENNISNIEFPIIINNPTSAIFIENNEIEYNFQFRPVGFDVSQISVFSASSPPVWIVNNELKSSLNDGSFLSTGIYIENSTSVIIESNLVHNFFHGVICNSSNSVNISNNTLTNNSRIGIFLDEDKANSRNYITCNDVTMKFINGISVQLRNCSELTEVTSNCLKDGRVGIQVEGSGTIPFIRNNYLYNYFVGINNLGHSGAIGTPSDPGLNTLWSNMTTALDVASSTPITIANNFGQTNCTWSTVWIMGNTALHSTASCGHQITTSNAVSQGNLNVNYDCENLHDFFQPLLLSQNDLYLPSSVTVLDYLNSTSDYFSSIMRLLTIQGFEQEYFWFLINGIEATQKEKDILTYLYFKYSGNYDFAISALEVISEYYSLNWINLEKILLQRMNSTYSLNEGDYSVLVDVLSHPEIYLSSWMYNKAVGISKSSISNVRYLYFYPEYTLFDLDDVEYDRITAENTIFDVFPNPTLGEITIRILEGKSVGTQSVIIYDILGNVSYTEAFSFVSGQVTVDLSHLVQGTYFICLISDNQLSEIKKIVKL